MTIVTGLNTNQGTLRIYGCGGAGINLVSHFDKVAGEVNEAVAVVYPAYMDTSRSNLKNIENQDHIFLLPEKDGSGKERRLNSPEIAVNIKNALNQFKPMDMNIVVFSASGGSGSVFGPLIMQELLQQGRAVIGLVVGSDESKKACKNTLATLKTLENMASMNQVPFVIFYEHNDEDTPRSDIDKRFQHAIGAIAVLASKQNEELDSTDILHALRFDKSAGVEPRLASLDIARSNDEFADGGQYVSMVSLYDNPDAEKTSIRPDYQATGYINGRIDGPKVFHFGVRLDRIAKIASNITASLADYEAVTGARVISARIADDSESENGLIF